MTELSFQTFYRLVHGLAPFPWQVQAAHLLAQRKVFPVSVPTALGKSAMVDAAVWAAVQGAWRRIAFVVDRRIVVDAVHQRAMRIAEMLAESIDHEVRAFAERLGEIQVVRLRGGVFGDDDWVLYPERLTIILSTVDQVGSRILFRGYGVSPRRWPMHAGFLSSDTLVVVDEAHISTPFLQTLEAVRAAGADVSVIPMSATLAEKQAAGAVGLKEADLALPVVQQRLQARKLARIQPCGKTEREFIQAAMEALQSALQKPGTSRVALIVNRVAVARRCFSELVRSGIPAVLLTGRTRPRDRDTKLMTILPEVEAGRQRREGEQALVVVATQTIEIGADFDFDALVTECAPMSSLKQRFGRLDRLGTRGESGGVILGRLAQERNDPVYGSSLADTWDWLQALAEANDGLVDFGIAALDETLRTDPAPAEPAKYAATLLPTHIQLLAQTGPFVPEFDLGPWLHGPTNRAPDVTLVWRDDLDAKDTDGWPKAVALLPPLLREALSLPVTAVRRWLTGAKQMEQWGDHQGSPDDDTTGEDRTRPVLRWRGPDDCRVIAAEEVRPGDTLVVPASYGGCDEWGWAPETQVAVSDLADGCLLERIEAGATRRIVLRLTLGRWHSFGAAGPVLEAQVRHLLTLEAEAAESEHDLDQALDDARSGVLENVSASDHPLAVRLRDPQIEHHPLGLVVRGTGTEEMEGVLETGRPVSLNQHHADVGRWAERLAARHPEAARIIAAARVHDAGKAEPRMQVLLHGNPLSAAQGPVLAKSALRRREQQLAAWFASGMPRGFRHEFATLLYAEVNDPLVRVLVATHHGYGRPWLVPCQDPEAPGARFARLDSQWAAAWAAQCVARGFWALATMEWILRAADARASIEEAQAEIADERG